MTVSTFSAGRRLLLSAICVAAAGVCLRALPTSDVVTTARLDQLPFAIGGWRGMDAGRLDPAIEREVRADQYTLRDYVSGAGQVGLYVAFYATQRSGHAIHSPLNCLPGTGWQWLSRDRQTIQVGPAGEAIEINRAVAQKDASRLLLYYWYQSRGRVVASDYRNRLWLMHDALTLHRSDGALVRVVAPIVNNVDPSPATASFIGALYPALVRHLPG